MTPKYLTRTSPGIEIFREHHEDWYRHTAGLNQVGPAWKLDVGAECNRLLEHADCGYLCTTERAADIRSIVERAANREGLETET